MLMYCTTRDQHSSRKSATPESPLGADLQPLSFGAVLLEEVQSPPGLWPQRFVTSGARASALSALPIHVAQKGRKHASTSASKSPNFRSRVVRIQRALRATSPVGRSCSFAPGPPNAPSVSARTRRQHAQGLGLGEELLKSSQAPEMRASGLGDRSRGSARGSREDWLSVPAM